MTGRRAAFSVTAAMVAVAIGVAGCTGSGADPSGDPPTGEPSPPPLVSLCLDQALFEVVVERLTPEEVLDRVHENDVEDARQLFRPDHHPRAGEYIPLDEWKPRQRRGWSKFITVPRQMNDLLPALHERLIEELTPAEFLARLTDEERNTVSALIYPDGHPQAGQFVPTSEASMFHLEWYLGIRPPGPGCPW